MDRAARQLRGDLACRKIGDLDIFDSGNGAAIVARAAWLGQRKSGTREECFGVFLQTALRRNGEHERTGHGALRLNSPALRSLLNLVSASIQIENPTAGIGLGAPSCVIRP